MIFSRNRSPRSLLPLVYAFVPDRAVLLPSRCSWIEANCGYKFSSSRLLFASKVVSMGR